MRPARRARVETQHAADTMASSAWSQPAWHALLRRRAVVRVRGADASEYLQGLVTNDMKALSPAVPAHLAFLERTGRVLLEAHVRVDEAAPGGFVLDCDARVSGALQRHLRKFALRKDVEVEDASEELAVLAGSGPAVANAADVRIAGAPDARALRDPRCAELGWRAIVPLGAVADEARVEGSAQVPEPLYDVCRTLLGVAEGPEDLPSAEALPLESNLDRHAAISFNKGCYLGQELTARTHFTGVVRKRLVPLVRAGADATPAEWPAAASHLPAWCRQPTVARALQQAQLDGDAPPLGEPGADVTLADGSAASVGKLRSSAGATVALALLRLEKAAAPGTELRLGGDAAPGVALAPVPAPWLTAALSDK